MASLSDKTDYTFVGKNVLRKEGADKLTGRARYVDDITLPGLLYGKTVRSQIAHGIIKSTQFDPDFDWSRIVIADWRDIPGDNVVALIEDDQPLLAREQVRHCGEPILLIACQDKELLEEAAQRVHINYEELPAVLTAEESLAKRALLYGQDNIFKQFTIWRGDVAEGFREADLIVEGTYRVGHQEQLYIETQGMIASVNTDGAITVQGSLQCPYYVHKALKRIFNLSDEKVIVIQTVTGGGFGGKEEYPSVIAGHAALLAYKANRPVKIIYDRAEDIAATTKRHPAIIKHKTGVKRDGRLVAAEIDILMDGGAYSTLSPVVLSRGSIHALGPYRCPNVLIKSRCVATNTPPNGAFRGFGAPQVCFAYEMHMDRIAAELGLSPLEVRQRNMLKMGDVTATGQTLSYSVGSEDVLNAVLERSDYRELYEKYRSGQTGTKRRGVGLSLFFHGAGFTGSGEQRMKAQAGVELLADGRVKILTGSTEIGQGTRTIFSQIVAEELGLTPDEVEMEEPDTSKVPDSGPTVASRTCMIVGKVLQLATRELKQTLTRFVAERYGIAEARLAGDAFIGEGDAPVITLAGAASAYIEQNGPLRSFKRYEREPGARWDDDTYTGDAYPVYSWAADVAEVEVDMDTYEITVLKITTAHDIGRSIHPIMVQGQIEGGTLQALGYGLCEEIVMKDGRVVNNRLTDYIIPTAVDAPEMETIIIENEYPYGPFGAKGAGELPMDGGAPAIVSAIYNATGALLTELPATPERLQRVLDEFPRPGYSLGVTARK